MNSEMSAIREQLLAECPPLDAAVGTPPVKVGMSSPELPALGNEGNWQSPQRVDVAQALRQRSVPPTGQHPSPEELAARSATSTEDPATPSTSDIQRYLQRLHREAENINELYRQQEMAIRKFQSSVNGLSLILMKQPQSAMMRIEQICEIQDAALTQVVQDDNHRYILTAVDLDLTVDVRNASETAAALRDRAQRATPPTSVPFMAALKESVSDLGALWPMLGSTFKRRSPMTPVNCLIWFGGGVIGRLALDLVLAAFPSLWPGVIGIIIGAVVFGLYRLLFAQSTDVAFIMRVFLALVGLIIGGQL